jgi:signal transduction histidine kinase
MRVSLLAMLIALAASAGAVMSQANPPRAADYGRAGRSIDSLRDALAAQQAKVVSGLLSQNEAAGDGLLRAARNNALGSVPSALSQAQAAVNDLFAHEEQVGRDRARRMAEQLARLPDIEAELATNVELLLDGTGDGSFSPTDVATADRRLAAIAEEALEVGTQVSTLLQNHVARVSQSRDQHNDDARARAVALASFAAAAALVSVLAAWRHREKNRAQETALTTRVQTAQAASAANEAQAAQLRQSDRRSQLELALVRLEQLSLTESIRSSLILCDTQLRVRLLNQAARERFALNETATGELLAQLPSLAPVVAGLGGSEALDRLLMRGETLEVKELQVPAPVPFWLFARVTPYFDEAGKMRGAILVADDITEQQKTRERLMHSERLAAMGRLSAQVAHEIRNPLSSLALNVDLLADECAPLGEEAQHLLQAITREVERLTEVTEEYLRLSRLRPPVMGREDVGHLLSELVSFMSEDMRRRGVECSLALGEGAEVLADPAQLRQALMNILRNSLESMPTGGQLRVTTRRQLGTIEIEVRDSGIGMNEHVLGRIFDPFYTTKDGGTGLGLPITQQIVAEHGGEISCDSQPGSGTAIRVALPTA